jgi:UDP-glucose 4-epimerase
MFKDNLSFSLMVVEIFVLYNRREGDIIKVWGDVAKSTNELGWKAELGIDEMMGSAWKWEQYLKENPIT